jgi:hypothetical protein
MAAEYAEDTKATARVATATITVIDHFFHIENSIGFRGSCRINSARYGSFSVPEPL